jgi:hypothetical protein
VALWRPQIGNDFDVDIRCRFHDLLQVCNRLRKTPQTHQLFGTYDHARPLAGAQLFKQRCPDLLRRLGFGVAMQQIFHPCGLIQAKGQVGVFGVFLFGLRIEQIVLPQQFWVQIQEFLNGRRTGFEVTDVEK